MRLRRALSLLALLAPLAFAQQQGFKFDQPDEAARLENEARQKRLWDEVSTPCRASLKNQKIMLLIGAVQSNGVISAQQQNYGPHFDVINSRLKLLGLRTYTAEEIRRQIAQAEIDAYFRNDPDAALAASKKLGAAFVLKGLITSQAVRNPMMAVNQVSVGMNFTLTGSNGRIVSATEASSSSYAGADVSKMALTLVNENADEVVARLYADYCQNAAPAKRAAPK